MLSRCQGLGNREGRWCRYVDQGGGKRKGAFAIYLEPWHADIFDWLDLRKNHGKEEVRLIMLTSWGQILSSELAHILCRVPF